MRTMAPESPVQPGALQQYGNYNFYLADTAKGCAYGTEIPKIIIPITLQSTRWERLACIYLLTHEKSISKVSKNQTLSK